MSVSTWSAPDRSRVWRYAVGVGAVVLGLLARFLLDPYLGNELPFVTFVLAVLVAGIVGGRGPALLATVLSVLGVEYCFMPPRHSLALFADAHVRLVITGFLVNGAAIALISGSLRQARREAERRAREAVSRARAVADAVSAREVVDRTLGAERARLAAVVESSDDAIIAKGLDGTITDWNAAAGRLLGFSREEAVGRPIHLIVPAERVADEARILDMLGRGERIDHYETERQAKNGERVPVSLSVSPIVDADGRIVGAASIARDIRARKAADAERERLLAQEHAARQEAEAANRAKDAFLATVSHELRTPLSPIIAWARMLNERKLDEARARHGLETIERNARAQARLIEDLLDVSRIVSGKLRLEVRSVELAPVIEAAIEAVRPAADARQIRLQAVLDSKSGAVAGDPDRLQQVVWNLLSNAVKFTPKGGRVQVVLERVNSHLEIAISDTGEGIAPDLLPHMFERFRQGDSTPARMHGGLGLGLAIVRHIVELHGGSVHAESAGPGQGATFTVKLPRIVLARTAGETARRSPHVADALAPEEYPSLGGLRVLVVDDEPDSNEIVSAVLEIHGAEVRTAMSASQALATIDGWRPDVVITDVGMPGEDGYAFLHALHAREELARVPVVALTAYAAAEDRVRLLAAGFQMHVPKPVEPVELVTVVARVAVTASPDPRPPDRGGPVSR